MQKQIKNPMELITARRGKETRTFTRTQWNEMTVDKVKGKNGAYVPSGTRFGWREVAEVPEELKDNIGGDTGSSSTTEPKTYADLSLEQLREEITSRGLTFAPAAKEPKLREVLMNSDKDGYEDKA